MQSSDCAGPSQTFVVPQFSMAPEDVDTEIETDDRVPDIITLFNRLHDLQQQVQEKDQTVHEQTEMLREKDQTLREKDQTLREQDQTIQKLLARQGRFKGRKCVVQ
jgi:predicted ribosome quality control (RQC) complex YloA/Tae2 family protein